MITFEKLCRIAEADFGDPFAAGSNIEHRERGEPDFTGESPFYLPRAYVINLAGKWECWSADRELSGVEEGDVPEEPIQVVQSLAQGIKWLIENGYEPGHIEKDEIPNPQDPDEPAFRLRWVPLSKEQISNIIFARL